MPVDFLPEVDFQPEDGITGTEEPNIQPMNTLQSIGLLGQLAMEKAGQMTAHGLNIYPRIARTLGLMPSKERTFELSFDPNRPAPPLQMETNAIPLPFEGTKSLIPDFHVSPGPLSEVTKELIRGSATPEMIGTLPAGELKPVQALYLSQTVPGAVESFQQSRNPALTEEERTKAKLNTAVNTLFSLGLGRGLMKGPGRGLPPRYGQVDFIEDGQARTHEEAAPPYEPPLGGPREQPLFAGQKPGYTLPVPARSFAPVTYAPKDLDERQAVQTQMRAMMASGQTRTPEFQTLFQRFIELQNKYGGVPAAQDIGGPYAEGVRTSTTEGGPEVGLEGQAQERVRVRDDEEAGLETGAGAEVEPERSVGFLHDLKAMANAVKFGKDKGILTPYEVEAYKGLGNQFFERGEESWDQLRKVYQGLIEKNQPKTDVSAFMYPLETAKQQFSLFSRDKPTTPERSPVLERDITGAADRKTVEHLGLFKPGSSALSALRKMASAPEQYGHEYSTLANWLQQNYGHVLNLAKFDKGMGRSERANYDPVTHKIHLDLANPQNSVSFRVLHEAAHAATWWQFEHPMTALQKDAAGTIRSLLEKATQELTVGEMNKIGHQEFGLPYALSSEQEFIAGLFTSPALRRHLAEIPVGPRNALQRVWDAVKKLLGIQPKTALDKAFDALAKVGEEKASINPAREDMIVPPVREPTKEELPFRITTDNPLPNFQPKEAANQVFAKKFAAERVPILGRLMGGKARIKTPQDEALATWYAERHGVGPAVASALGEEIRGKVNSAFKADKEGNLNVEARGTASKKISDVFEGLQRRTGDYQLTPEQTRVWTDTLKPLLDRMSQMAKDHELVDVMDENGSFKPYFPRIVTKLPREGQPNLFGGNKVGAKQFFQKQRMFETELEGWSKGVEYSTDVEARLVRGVERIYRAIADKRLSEDPVLGGKTRAQLVSDLREAYSEELASGEMTPERVQNIATSLQSQGAVWSPAFFGRIFTPEVARTLNREFSAEQSRLRRSIANANSMMKALKLGFDFGSGQIQLLPTLYSNPGVWAKANFKALGSMFSPQVFSEYVRKNQSAVRELSQLGSSVGRLQEQMAGLGGGEPLPRLLGKVPVVGKALKEVPMAFGRQFQTSLDVAKVELWKAWREVTPREEWPKLVQAIESQLLSGRMESAMVPHNRALLERVALLAPSYYRGAVNYIAALGESGVPGHVARRSMGAFILGSLATYYGMGKLAGMSDEEIKERMNPARADFMMWRWKDGDKTINVGFGGIFRSLLRLAGNVVKTSTEHPGNWKALSPDKNPITRWYRGHAGPVVSLLWDKFTGKDFLGEKSDIENLPTAVLPIAAERGGRIEKATGVLGLSSYQAPSSGMKETARKMYPGREFSSLTLGERAKVQKSMKSESPLPSEKEERRILERATEKEVQRREDLRDRLPKDQVKWLEANKLRMPGYDESYTYNRTQLSLTDEEKVFFQEAIAKHYQEAIARLMVSPTFQARSTARKQVRLNEVLTMARDRSRSDLRRRMRKP